MCLAVPAKIIEKKGLEGVVDFGKGVTREVNFSLLEDAEVGDYVMIHAGYPIAKVDSREAEKTLKMIYES